MRKRREALVHSWQVPELAGIDCFRASELTHHYGRHSHPTWAIGVIENGIGGSLHRGAQECIHPGEIVVINPEEAHTGYAAGEEPLSYRMFYVTQSFFGEILASASAGPHFREIRINDGVLAAKLRRAHQSLEQQPGLKPDTLLIEALVGFAETHGHFRTRSEGGREPAAISLTKQFLKAHYRENVRISELSALTQLDRAYLIRSFRRAVGMPPHQWLLQVRIEEAKRLLSMGQSIAIVAGDLGFADQSHLTRKFKSLTGLSPREYVRGHYCSRLQVE